MGAGHVTNVDSEPGAPSRCSPWIRPAPFPTSPDRSCQPSFGRTGSAAGVTYTGRRRKRQAALTGVKSFRTCRSSNIFCATVTWSTSNMLDHRARRGPSSQGIEGNEVADELAKDAAGARTVTERQDIYPAKTPVSLRGPMISETPSSGASCIPTEGCHGKR
jgi:hypothetical protein